jgi:hypothetical protein
VCVYVNVNVYVYDWMLIIVYIYLGVNNLILNINLPFGVNYLVV